MQNLKLLNFYTLRFSDPKHSRQYIKHLRKSYWMYALSITAIKFGFNLAYFIAKYTDGVDNLYLGLMLANLLLFVIVSLLSKRKSIACNFLGLVMVIGLFIESF